MSFGFNAENRDGQFVSSICKAVIQKTNFCLLYFPLFNASFYLFSSVAALRYIAAKYTDYAGWGKTLEQRTQVQSILQWASCDFHRLVRGYGPIRFCHTTILSKECRKILTTFF